MDDEPRPAPIGVLMALAFALSPLVLVLMPYAVWIAAVWAALLGAME